MMYRGFKIENERAYVCRLSCWAQHSDHSWIASWHVYDSEGNKIAGGHDSGSNTRSGSAKIARAKDAKALVDGFIAWGAEPENRHQCAVGIIHKPTWNNMRLDRRLADAFNEGYSIAQRLDKESAQ